MIKYPGLVQLVVDFMEEVKAKFPDHDELDSEYLTYANGNDGTDFDWNWNERLCEIGWGLAKNGFWSFKCCINTDGKARVCCYPHGEVYPVKEIEEQLMTAKDAKNLMHIMYDSTDAKGVWDAKFDEIEWEV